MKKNNSSAFWKKMRFKYKLSFLNEKALEEVFSLRVSFLSIVWSLFALVVVVVVLTAVVIIQTPVHDYLPGYLDDEMREQLLTNGMKTDSLEEVIRLQTSYLENITQLLNGTNEVTPMPADDTLTVRAEELKKSEMLTEFVRAHEEDTKYSLNMAAAVPVLSEDAMPYKPVVGYVSSHFDLNEKHYGIDVATKPKESILATMRGIVIFAGFEATGGYTIELQHPNGIVSVYKHNAVLLKKQGESVNAGEVIAIVGNSGTLSNGTHLHFELWFKGKPLNPEELITF
ncbi:peptidase, M23/M37 family [Candidatus Symbiothrix dinenymphae]|nr:peptidase, M23/M37 family [Candidatus Symbiothrix dinenymphae]